MDCKKNCSCQIKCKDVLKCVNDDLDRIVEGLPNSLSNFCEAVAKCVDKELFNISQGIQSQFQYFGLAVYKTLTEIPGYSESVEKVLTIEDGSLIWQVADFSGGGDSYTDEQARDAVGNALTDTPTIDFTYTDINDTIEADVKVGAIDNDQTEMLMWDGTNILRRTIGSLPFFNEEDAQDAVFSNLVLFNGLSGNYDDNANTYLGKLGGSFVESTTLLANNFAFYVTNASEVILNAVSSGFGSTFDLGLGSSSWIAFNGSTTTSIGMSTSTIDFSQAAGSYTFSNVPHASSQNRLVGITTSTGAIGNIDLGAGLSLSGGTLTNTITQYTDEDAQDAIFNHLTVQNGLSLLYNDDFDLFVVELGGNLIIHDTVVDADFFKFQFKGSRIYEYPFEFYQNQYFQSSTAIVSFLSHGHSENDVPVPITVRLGINYTGDVYQVSPTPIDGYFGNDVIGYWMGTNVFGSGSNGLAIDDETSKSVGIFFHTQDTSNTRAVTIFGAEAISSPGGIFGGSMPNFRIATFHQNKDIQFWGYPSSRNDGTTSKALYIDNADGIIKYGDITGVGGASINPVSPITYNGGTGDLGFDQSINLNNNARVAVRANNGVTTYKRRRLNFIDGSDITFNISDDAGDEEVEVSANLTAPRLNKVEVRFKVGDTDYPQNDENEFDGTTTPVPVNTIGKKLSVYREGERQYDPDTTQGIVYNSLTGIITFYPNLATGERIIIEIEDASLWTVIQGATQDPGGFPYILPLTLS